MTDESKAVGYIYIHIYSEVVPFGEGDMGLILSNLMPSQDPRLLVERSVKFDFSAAPGSGDNVSPSLQPAHDH